MSKPLFTFEHFLDYCKSKNPNQYYNYTRSDVCACAQYAHSIGMTFNEALDASYHFRIFDKIAENGKWTWGELAARLEQHMEHAKSGKDNPVNYSQGETERNHHWRDMRHAMMYGMQENRPLGIVRSSFPAELYLRGETMVVEPVDA